METVSTGVLDLNKEHYLWPLVYVLNNTLILGIWCSTIPHLPGCFCPWTFFENIGFNTMLTDVTSSYSTWIFCRGVSGFATDCPCGVWCRGLTTCLLHVGPPFGNRIFKKQLGCRFDIMDNKSYFLCFDICNHIYNYMIHEIIFRFYLLRYSLFFQVLLY